MTGRYRTNPGPSESPGGLVGGSAGASSDESADRHADAAVRRMLGLLAAFVTGSAISVQARINAALAARLDDGVLAALISFGTGLVLLAAVALVMPPARRGLGRVRVALVERRLRWWQLTGGLSGALVVASQGLTVGLLGVAVFTVAVVGGQLGSSLLMDRLGVGPGGRRPVTGRRLAGALLAIGAVGLTVSDRLVHPAGLALALLPLLAGVAAAWQQGVNGRIGLAARPDGGGDRVGSTLPAVLLNFATGTMALALVAAVGVFARGWVKPLPLEPLLYLGGPLGVAFIASMVVVVRQIGVLLMGLGLVAGQLVSSLLLDLLAPTGAHPLTALTLTGTALTLVAAGIAVWPSGDAGRGATRAPHSARMKR